MATTSSDSKREQLAALQERLTEQVESLRNTAEWKRMLDFASKFHRYSANNMLLIWGQCQNKFERGELPSPEPGSVAGFNTWKLLGRTVDKGQRGIQIMAPVRYRSTLIKDASGEVRRPERGEKPASGEELVKGAREIATFRVEHVFTVDQTSGEPLPSIPEPEPVRGEAPEGMLTGLTTMTRELGYTLEWVPDKSVIGGADGQTSFVDRSVKVRADLDDAARANVLVHEIAHVTLHDPKSDNAIAQHRGIREVEAESVAYIVAAAHGLDTSEEALPYVAGWLGRKDTADVVQATAGRVVTAAHQILAELDTEQFPDGSPPGIDRALAERTQQRSPIPLPEAIPVTQQIEGPSL